MKKSNRVITGVILSGFAAIIVMAVAFRTFLPEEYLNSTSFFSNTTIVGNGKIVTQSIPTGDFDTITASGKFDIHVEPGKNNQVTITTDENVVPNISVTTKDNKLVIEHEHDVSVRPKINIVTKKISTINLNGHSSLEANIPLTKNFSVNVNGKAIVILSGRVENLTLTSHGKSQLDTKNLFSENVIVKSAGKSMIVTRAEKSLNVQSVGKSVIQYYGNPVVTNNATGSGTLTKLE
jgi:hypothetical protein